jgi:hypothetical protein
MKQGEVWMINHDPTSGAEIKKTPGKLVYELAKRKKMEKITISLNSRYIQ